MPPSPPYLGPSAAPSIAGVDAELQRRLDGLPAALAHRRTFVRTYSRTTQAVGAAVTKGVFEDPEWVVRWDVAFADLFFAAHDADLAGEHVPRPWRLAFGQAANLPPLAHLLLGMNAHINYDLPQALMAVISDQEFADPACRARRSRDHGRIDTILAGRVAAEDQQLGGARRLRDRVLTPANRLSSRRFLREARYKVWRNAAELQSARLLGPQVYQRRLAELEVLAAAKIADLLSPGPVLLRLAAGGFGVVLPPP